MFRIHGLIKSISRMFNTRIYNNFDNKLTNEINSKFPSRFTHNSNAEEMISKVPIIEVDADYAYCRVLA